MFDHGAREIDHGVGEVSSGQRVPVSPQGDTVYTLTVTGVGGDRVSRTLQVRVVPAPAVTAFTATPVDRGVGRVTSAEGYALVDAVLGKRLRLVRPAGRLPESVDLAFQDLAIEALAYGGGTVRATASGALAEAIDVARVTVAAGTVEWHLFAAGAAALALPHVPVLPAPPWQDGTLVQAELVALRGHPGFDALWAEARDGGSLGEVLLWHDSASATGKLSRSTPSYSILLGGYGWEDYGLIASSDGRIHCGASCGTSWPAGTTVHLTATPTRAPSSAAGAGSAPRTATRRRSTCWWIASSSATRRSGRPPLRASACRSTSRAAGRR